MIVLGIESSCDETAAALVRDDGEVIADVVASQVAEHAPYGGVVPEIAARAHLRALIPVLDAAVSSLDGGMDQVDAIAVTNGPGLVGALLVGVSAAKALAFATGKPLIGVNHLDGHLLAPFLRRGSGEETPPAFPYIGLLASGGHTAIYRVNTPREISLVGQTRDDAAGEAFDKVAKLLGLGYPGGPVIDRLAKEGDPSAHDFPAPMPSRKNPDFSFSGLKTAVARHVRTHGVPTTEQGMKDICASFQKAVVSVLANKAVAACEREGISTLALGGGVAANSGLRARAKALCDKKGLTLCVPSIKSCTDNAAMIAYAGCVRYANGERDDEVTPYSRDPKRLRGKFRADGSFVPRKR